MRRLRCAEKFYIPYEEALEKIKEVGKVLDERIPETFDLFVEKGWLKYASCRENKTALSSKVFCRLMSREFFSTYLGSFASMSQQAIMYGHAWHFWLQRGLPAQERKIPRALMEVAGHFFCTAAFRRNPSQGRIGGRKARGALAGALVYLELRNQHGRSLRF